jgi:hypothetical protein
MSNKIMMLFYHNYYWFRIDGNISRLEKDRSEEEDHNDGEKDSFCLGRRNICITLLVGRVKGGGSRHCSTAFNSMYIYCAAGSCEKVQIYSFVRHFHAAITIKINLSIAILPFKLLSILPKRNSLLAKSLHTHAPIFQGATHSASPSTQITQSHLCSPSS